MSYEQPLNAIEEAPEALRPIMAALCTTAIALAKTIARGPLGGSLGHLVGENSDGDGQKALDVMADNAFADALKAHSVRWYASEEQETVVELDSKGRYAIAIDPLDGSSNIDVNVSIGTIFSVYEARPEAEESFLRPAREQIAAGYFIYGPQTGLVVTFGQGSFHYIWDDEQRRFVKIGDALCLTETSREFAINASNYRQWHKPVRTFIDDYLAGENGPHGQNFNMRWVASLVADTHRILSRGGIFLYPGDNRPGYKDGRLRMVYECAPIAMLIAQAGGEATDGSDSILDKAAPSLHARTPFIFGSSAQVKQMTNYHDLPEQEVSALFGKRGLFRAPA